MKRLKCSVGKILQLFAVVFCTQVAVAAHPEEITHEHCAWWLMHISAVADWETDRIHYIPEVMVDAEGKAAAAYYDLELSERIQRSIHAMATAGMPLPEKQRWWVWRKKRE